MESRTHREKEEDLPQMEAVPINFEIALVSTINSLTNLRLADVKAFSSTHQRLLETVKCFHNHSKISLSLLSTKKKTKISP
jgi:predicted ATP-binding protein involved in virulence